MPSIHRQLMREGLAAKSRLHTAEYDLERLTLHCMDLERTLYRLAVTIGIDKLVDLDHEAKLATPHDETATYLSDYWTQAQLFAALTHAAELTTHICDSCEGTGDGHHDREEGTLPCVKCDGTGEITERVTTDDRIRGLVAPLAPGVVQ